MTQNNLIVSQAPHVRSGDSVKKVMWSVVFALIPAGAAGVFIFGMHSLWLTLTAVLSALLAEALVMWIRKRPMSLSDGSALITGMLVAYNLPPAAPLWIPAVGSFVGIFMGKQLFGGIGRNIFNPALVGRAFLMASWPVYMTTWSSPRWAPDAVSTASPLSILKEASGHAAGGNLPDYLDLVLGNRAGCVGEVCIIALLIGALFLLIRGYITWHTPVSFIGAVGILSWAFMGDGFLKGDWVFYILSGGLVLGAFFMATDMVTTPITRKGQVVFGLGCGIITFLIRKYGGYPEGVSYSILIMNAATPVIDRFVRPGKFGGRKK